MSEPNIARSPDVAAPVTTVRSVSTSPVFLLALFLSIFAVSLFGVLRTPPMWTVDAGSPGDTRFLDGFSVSEVEANGTTTFRWSTPDSRLVFHGVNTITFILEMRLYNEQLAPNDSGEIAFERREQTFATWEVANGWRVYQWLPSEQAIRAEREAAYLSLMSDTRRPGANDGRDLGIVVDWLRMIPLDRTYQANTAWLVLQQVLMLTWLLAVIAGALWQLGRLVLSRRIRLRVVGGLIGIAAIGIIVWAQRNPYTLAWTLPPLPWTLGLATLLLIGDRLIAAIRSLFTAVTHRLQHRLTALFIAGIGLVLLSIAQLLLQTQLAIGIGLALTVIGLIWLLSIDQPDRTSSQSLWLVTRDGLSRPNVWLLLTLIFLVALGMRLYRIADLPYGLWRDEARHGLIALRILEDPDYRPIYVASGRVNMPALGFYPFALGVWLWGIHDWSMRAITGVAGALTVFPLYGFVVRLSGRRVVALLAAAFLAVSSWHVTISRFSFPTIFEPLFGLIGLWLLIGGLTALNKQHTTVSSDQRSRIYQLGGFLLAGICLGLAVQAYHTGRMVPAVALCLALLFLWQHPQLWRRWLVSMAVLGVGLTLAAGPLMLYAINRPDAMNDRVGRVFLLSESSRNGRAPLAMFDDEAVGRHLQMFNARGDSNGRHHAPERPMLDFATGLGFVVGCAALLRYWRDWRSLVLLAALGISLVPSALAVQGPHAMRSIGAAAFACIIAALGWAELWRIVSSTIGQHSFGQQFFHRRVWQGGALAVASVALALNVWTYFGSMAVDGRVWGSVYPVHTQIGTYLQRIVNEQGESALSQMLVPENLARNSVFTYMANDLPVRLFNSESLPSLAQSGEFVVLSGYTYREDVVRLADILGPAPTPVLRGPDFPSGGEPSFVVYQVP